MARTIFTGTTGGKRRDRLQTCYRGAVLPVRAVLVALLVAVAPACGGSDLPAPDKVALDAAELRKRAERLLPPADELADPTAVATAAERAEERIAIGDHELGIVVLHLLAQVALRSSAVLLQGVVARMESRDTDGAEKMMAAAKLMQESADLILQRRNEAFGKLRTGYADAGTVGRRAVVMAAWRIAIACDLERATARFVLGLPGAGDAESVMLLRHLAVGDLTARSDAHREETAAGTAAIAATAAGTAAGTSGAH